MCVCVHSMVVYTCVCMCMLCGNISRSLVHPCTDTVHAREYLPPPLPIVFTPHPPGKRCSTEKVNLPVCACIRTCPGNDIINPRQFIAFPLPRSFWKNYPSLFDYDSCSRGPSPLSRTLFLSCLLSLFQHCFPGLLARPLRTHTGNIRKIFTRITALPLLEDLSKPRTVVFLT